MKVHRRIKDGLDDNIKNQAVEVGLDRLDFDKTYRLYRIKNIHFSLEPRVCVGQGEIRLTGSENYVSLFISSLREWFRTSPVLSCQCNKDKYIIETINSVYELVEDE